MVEDRRQLHDCETLLRAEERVIGELEDAARAPVRLPTPDEVLETARNFEKTLMTDATRGRAMLL